MGKMKNIRERIEKIFSRLESFWGSQVPEALIHDGWEEYDLMNFVEDYRAIPFDQYDQLIKAIGEDLKIEYAERLNKLNELIAQYKPELIKLFKS